MSYTLSDLHWNNTKKEWRKLGGGNKLFDKCTPHLFWPKTLQDYYRWFSIYKNILTINYKKDVDFAAQTWKGEVLDSPRISEMLSHSSLQEVIVLHFSNRAMQKNYHNIQYQWNMTVTTSIERSGCNKCHALLGASSTVHCVWINIY